jgi:hypothetical protein
MQFFPHIKGRIVQAYTPGGQPRLYQNLNPAAAIPVDRDQVFRLNNFYNHHYRLNRGEERSQYVPNARYVFVKMATGETLMHTRIRHPALAEGRPVLYAGEAQFDNGKLQWWSNASGNYRPDPGHAAQAGLPMEQFYSHEDITRGVHTRPALPQSQGKEKEKPVALQAKMFANRYPQPFPGVRR